MNAHAMKLTDDLYGEVVITEPILIELIQSPALQRLKKINQLGLPPGYYHLKSFSRYEHSLGVMLFLRRFNVSLEEQVAGLLHDVSHTAFSHIVDWLFGDPSIQDHQDKALHQIMVESGIDTILARYGFKAETISQTEHYPVLENNLPDLCADRLDYSLREYYLWDARPVVDQTLASLRLVDNRLVFDTVDAARAYALYYLDCQRQNWGSREAMLRYELMARLLKKAVERNVIILADFQTDDQTVLDRLWTSGDAELIADLTELRDWPRQQLLDKYADLSLRYKNRYVDPLVLVGQGDGQGSDKINNQVVARLSQLDPDFAEVIRQAAKAAPLL